MINKPYFVLSYEPPRLLHRIPYFPLFFLTPRAFINYLITALKLSSTFLANGRPFFRFKFYINIFKDI